jgi:hypothetical protein
MFSFHLDGLDPLLKKFDLLERRYSVFREQDWQDEFMAWQGEDLNRRKPWSRTSRYGGAKEQRVFTLLQPRGRKRSEAQWRARARRARIREMKLKGIVPIPRIIAPKEHQPKKFSASPKHARAPRVVGTRKPILRKVLQDKLYERMTSFAQEVLKWPK